ncbi:pyridoxal phosphate-dependent aminotransferase [Octadecabacter sp. 1_MG-2023]|uniref:pyridoxal phosphate-dependent aminotransferase n=1 Tax=unclassified Octadecabacter TaxID=196158 RepID=UPI001C0953BD|nr:MULTISPECIES: pyridoxal phosphate-dependent aminotransferase [unclassified Octadecabacter]MBU2993413.1 pyridoxal phosphate-dependent aminotransferase [Octadecabacter sp. B2R22]MDO6733131.1 pyridoxal phosphate-dependent aminotransferase [Octadecabacter sp. 1_MG-2023]
MKLSHRITHLTPSGSDGWEVFYKARALVAEGEPIIELTIGEHDIRTHPDILTAMNESAKSGHTGYAAVPGTLDLRKAVAERIEARTGVPTTHENILITPGGQAALFATHNAVCDEGDTALFIDPYYATYPGTIRGVGAIPQSIPARPENGFQPSAADLNANAAGATSLLVNTPNNPTGAVYSLETLAAIADTCIANDLWLISDEVYDTQIWDGTHISPRALPNMAQRTLVVGSMSKSHAMTGSRVGWVCGPKEVIEHMINLATHTTYGVPGYIQDAAHFALGQGTPLEDEVSAPFARRREITERLIATQNVVKASPTQGAMYAMLDIRATGMSGFDFANDLLDTHQIATMPGESFGTSAAGHVRVAMTVDDDSYDIALHTLLDFAATKVR